MIVILSSYVYVKKTLYMRYIVHQEFDWRIDLIVRTSWLLSDASKIGGPSPTSIKSHGNVMSLLVLQIFLEKIKQIQWEIDYFCNLCFVYPPEHFLPCGTFKTEIMWGMYKLPDGICIVCPPNITVISYFITIHLEGNTYHCFQ